jgi:cytochrome c peroxidase
LKIRTVAIVGLAVAALAACSDYSETIVVPPVVPDDDIRALARANGMTPVPAPPAVRPDLVELGRALAFDRILSGTRDISCMSCHLPSQGTSDGLALSIGQGAAGLGPGRVHPTDLFIPRNSLALFNLHALGTHFWDGRLSFEGGNLTSPAGALLTPEMRAVLEFGGISAVPLFPVLSREEMRGFDGNELAGMDDADMPAIWAGLMERLGTYAEYHELFEAAYPGVDFEDMTFAHAANAIAGFLVSELFTGASPWDRFLAGDDRALTAGQMEGAAIFLREGRCAICHNGPLLSDRQFHNVALPQVGPGSGHGPAGDADFGRGGVTADPALRFAFRTPPLRNVDRTGPWGHGGQFPTLRDFVDHYSESDRKLLAFDPARIDPRLRASLRNGPEILETRSPHLQGLVLSPAQIDRLVDFLGALTDDRARALDGIAPASVPSGLPVDR